MDSWVYEQKINPWITLGIKICSEKKIAITVCFQQVNVDQLIKI
jgi:hypothetical protein